MNWLWEAETLSENKTKLKFTLKDGTSFVGYWMGIEPAFDPIDGEELDYDLLRIKPDNYFDYISLKNEEIEKVERAS